MEELVHGYRRFHSEVLPQKRELYQSLADGQSPKYMFITCCDSRLDPIEFTGSEPGDMFVERSVGNIIPLPHTSETESSASIEYAIGVLKVKHIVVCGHSNCGAMKALLNPTSLANLPIVAAWISNAGLTRETVSAKYPGLEGDELLDATIHENGLRQLEHLRPQPSVIKALKEGAIEIHGWVFEVERGRVVEYDRSSGGFLPLLEAHAARLD